MPPLQQNPNAQNEINERNRLLQKARERLENQNALRKEIEDLILKVLEEEGVPTKYGQNIVLGLTKTMANTLMMELIIAKNKAIAEERERETNTEGVLPPTGDAQAIEEAEASLAPNQKTTEIAPISEERHAAIMSKRYDLQADQNQKELKITKNKDGTVTHEYIEKED